MGESIEILEERQDPQLRKELDEFSDRMDEFEQMMGRNKRHQLLPKSVSGMAAVGTSEFYAKADHIHPGVAYLLDSKGNQHTGEAPAEQHVIDDRFAPRLRASTIVGLWTFDRNPLAPFAIAEGSANVPYLDADLLDGYQGAEVAILAEDEDITGQWSFTTNRIQITGNGVPADGVGLEIGYLNTWSYIASWDRTNTLSRNIHYQATQHHFYTGTAAAQVRTFSINSTDIQLDAGSFNMNSLGILNTASIQMIQTGWIGSGVAALRLVWPVALDHIDLLGGGLHVNSTNAVQFNAATEAISSKNAGSIDYDAATQHHFDSGNVLIDGTTTFGGNTLHTTTVQAQFRDPQIYLASLADGHLDVEADISIDLNQTTIIDSEVEISEWPAAAGYALFGNTNLDHSVIGNYALVQSAAGLTLINAAAGQQLGFRIANAAIAHALGATWYFDVVPVCSAGGIICTLGTATYHWMQEGGNGSVQWRCDYNADQMLFGVNERVGTQFVLGEYAWLARDHDHADQANPTLYGHDARDPNISNNAWWSITHDATGMLISTGANTGAGSAPATIDNYMSFAPRGVEAFRIYGDGDAIFHNDLAILGSLAVDRIESIPASPFSSIVFANQLLLEESALVINQFDVDVQLATRPAANPPGEGIQDGFPTLDFDAATDESVYLTFHLNHGYAPGGIVRVHIDFFVDTAPAGAANVVWGAEYKLVSHGDNFDFTAGTSTVLSIEPITVGTPANDARIHETSALSFTTVGWLEGDTVYIRLYRDADHASDTFTGDVRVIGQIHIEWLCERLGEPV